MNNKITKNKINNNYMLLVIGILLIITSIVFMLWRNKTIENENHSIRDIRSIILYAEQKVNQIGFVELTKKPQLLASIGDSEYGYYIGRDNEYFYLLYITESEYNKIDWELNEFKKIHIDGNTIIIPKEIKEKAIEAYNQSYKKEETIDNYDNIFGVVGLSAGIKHKKTFIPTFVGVITLITGIITIILSIKLIIKNKKIIKKLPKKDKELLDKELSGEVKIIKRNNIVFTKNMLVDLNNYNYIDYKSINNYSIKKVSKDDYDTIIELMIQTKDNKYRFKINNNKDKMVIEDILKEKIKNKKK